MYVYFGKGSSVCVGGVHRVICICSRKFILVFFSVFEIQKKSLEERDSVSEKNSSLWFGKKGRGVSISLVYTALCPYSEST